MKLKGVSIVEQHVEKLVLLVFALFAIGVFVMQFDVMGDPNAVKIDNNLVPPDQAVEVVKERALRLKGQMEGEGGRVEPPAQAGPLKVVETMLSEPVAGQTQTRLSLAPAWSSQGYRGPSAPTEGPDIQLGNAYLEVAPPAPTGVVARAFAGTIDPVEPLMIPELASFLPAEQPLDKRAVTVQGAFDAASLRAMLAVAPEDERVNPLRTEWWQGRMEILDVEVIRQEIHEDGTMGPEETVGSLPGRFSLRDRIRSSETAPKDLPSILRGEGDHREEIRRPAYYNMIMGEAWIWPSLAAEGSAAGPDQKDIERLVHRYGKLAREKEQLEAQLEKIGDLPSEERNSERPGPRRSEVWPQIPATWLAQRTPPGGRPGGSPDDGSERLREKRRKQRIQAMQDRIEALAKEMEAVEAELAEKYEVGVDGKPLKGEAVESFTEALTSLTGPDALDSVTLWGHDIGVEPGRAYRYKMRVWVTNPLFGHVADVPESQHELAGRSAVASADSAWSNTVQTYPERVFFVSGAMEAASGGQLGLVRDASASVDAYEFYYGYWRGGSVSLDQGDRIRVDLTLPELPVFEVEKNEQGNAFVKGSTPLPTERTIAEDAMLLEVGVGLGSGDRGQVHEAIFAWLNGELDVRVAEVDSESPMSDQVWASSEASKTAEVRQPGADSTLKERAPSREGEENRDERPGTPPTQPGRRPGMSPGGG